jgi:hypothetical protein
MHRGNPHSSWTTFAQETRMVCGSEIELESWCDQLQMFGRLLQDQVRRAQQM